jgi:predicted ATPase
VTARLVQRDFILEELGTRELKGVASPVAVFRVEGLREIDDEIAESERSEFSDLVGRDEEIGLLLRRWTQSKEGLGQIVLISGEAGMGKSSLVAGLRHHVRAETYTRVTFRCSPYHMNSALYPIIDHVQRVLEWDANDTAETKLAKLERGLQNANLEPDTAVPLLAALLALDLPEGRYPALPFTPQQQRQQTHDVLVTWLFEEAERQPVFAVWEDLHWADPSTLEVLSLFVDQTPTAAMLHILTCRPSFEPPWTARSHLTPITLNHLDRPQVTAIISRLSQGKTLSEEVVEHIVTKTDGVPLFVEELTKTLLESHLLGEQPHHDALTGTLTDIAIPATLQDSLMARLDQLPTAKSVAQRGVDLRAGI